MESVQRAVCYLAITVIASSLAGCGNQESKRLIGRWEGQAEGARNQTTPDKTESDITPNNEQELTGEPNSLLSDYAFSITLDFQDSRTVLMSVAGGEDNLPLGSQPIEGQWHIVEVEKKPDDDSDPNSSRAASVPF